jgi:hypothetical protein
MRIALALLALLLAAPAGADGLLLSGEGDRTAVDLAPDDLQPGLSVYDTNSWSSEHRWVVPADPPRESSAAPVIVILQQPQQSVDRPHHHRYGDPIWKQACRARGRYPRACLPSAYGRRDHHQRQHVQPAALPAPPTWPQGIPQPNGGERHARER